MKVSVKVCDILSENSEALLMTVDGTIIEPGGSPAWGNVGQALNMDFRFPILFRHSEGKYTTDLYP